MKAKKDYYLVLGVPRNASAEGIRRAYRRLARASHPDRTGAEEAASFREAAEAYDVLSDPEKRRRYNRSLEGPRVVPRPVARRRPARATEPEPLVPGRGASVEPEPLVPEHGSTVDLRFSGPAPGRAVSRKPFPVPETFTRPSRRFAARFAPCPLCVGTGAIFRGRCPWCDGRSVVRVL